MKTKRTKTAGQYRRHYPNTGILMYRERHNPISVPANTKVIVIARRPNTSLCEVDHLCIEIPNQNLI